MINGATIAAPDYIWFEDDRTTVMEWRRENRCLQVFVGAGEVEILRSWGPNVHTHMEDGPMPSEAEHLFGWLIFGEELQCRAVG